jgi:hypothetical protein
MFEHEEGGSGGSSIKTAKESTSSSRLDAREVEMVVVMSLWLHVSLGFVCCCGFVVSFRPGGKVSELSEMKDGW